MPASSRIDWLDGWRTIAVAIVILSHLALRGHWAYEPPGKLGVFIFFSISGFIVTRLLLQERARAGRVDIGAFFIRRVGRILPPLLLYVIVCLCLGQGSAGGAARALSFTCNIVGGPGDCGWIFGHTWSLAFEEQYYLIVPFLVAGRLRWYLVLPLALALLPFAFPVHFIGRIGAIQVNLLLGLGALVTVSADRLRPVLARVPAVVSLGLLALSGAWVGLVPSPLQAVTGLLVPFAIVIAVFALPEASPAARALLASLPMRTIGLWSYSFYLWQQLALSDQKLLPPLGAVGLALLVSALSFYTLERATRTWARAAIALRDRRAGPSAR